MKTLNVEELTARLEVAEAHNRISYEIGYRGGHYTMTAELALELVGIIGDYFDEYLELLPENFGVGCNYLGGGLRGALMATGNQDTFQDKGFSKVIATKLAKLAEACKNRYLDLEGAMNDEENEGETNWEAVGTNAMRAKGVIRAY